jgi:5-formyltetrahydrofolate cyclo-ligase
MLAKKKILRKIIKVRVSAISPEERKKREEILHNNLFSMPEFVAAKSVMLFANLPDEIGTFSLIDRCISMGKKVFLPVINGEDMTACEFTGDYKIGKYDIKEPITPNSSLLTPHSMDFVLVPGVGFSPSGYRLGRGKGYYDKFLSKQPELFTVGVCFREQFYLDIPTEPHDIQMRKVIVC